MGSGPFLFSNGRPEGDYHLTLRRLTNFSYRRIELDLDSFSSQTVCQGLGNLGAFMAQDLAASLKDGDLAAEPMHQRLLHPHKNVYCQRPTCSFHSARRRIRH
jgi:hypothetical protein